MSAIGVHAILGAIVGAFVGYVICLFFGPKGHYVPPHYWQWDSGSKIGCFGSLIVILICAAIGAVIGNSMR